MSAVKKPKPAEIRIEQIEHLPPFPLLSNIIRSFIVAENDGDIRPLISTVETEPSIVAKLIGVANSAAFGRYTPVRSIKDAIMRLGVLQLKSLVFSIILSSRFNTKRCPTFDIARFWTDSMLLAYCASLMADRCRIYRYDRNEAYSIGLTSHIGLLALINIAPDEMNGVLENDHQETLTLREQQALDGIDHYDAGATLLKHWQLPKSYWLTIAHLKDNRYIGNYNEFVTLLKRAKELVKSDFTLEAPAMDRNMGLTAKDIVQISETFENDKSWIMSFARHF